MRKNKEQEYWKYVEEISNKQCITCEFCFPKITDDIENETYEYDYSECICASHEGEVKYGTKLTEKQLMSSPKCWSLSLNEYLRISSQIEKQLKSKA